MAWMAKIGSKGLRMSSGDIRHFKSKKKRDAFEKFALAIKHGMTKRRKSK